MEDISIKHIVFDHDGTLVDTSHGIKKLFPGVDKVLSMLEDKKIPMYVWTARNYKSTVSSLESLQCLEMFKGFSCPPIAPAKPSPDGIVALFTDQGLSQVDPRSVMVIGDSPGDMYGGKAFGAFCVAVTWAYGGDTDLVEILKEYGADSICSTTDELIIILKQHIKVK